ncbi:MAG: T9SS type A sorting domain-containing protein [Candidatus Zixiibacteriota bacterium]
MKRNLMLFFVVAGIVLSFSAANAVTTVTAKINPLVNGQIALNDTVNIEIHTFNDYMEASGGSLPFVLYEKDGNPMNVNYIAIGTKSLINYRNTTVTQAFISEYNGWAGFFPLFDDYTGFGVNAVMPDTINWTGAGLAAWPLEDTTLHISFTVQITNTGMFCFDTCQIPNVAPTPGMYDWLLEDMNSFFLSAAEGPSQPLCWEVVDTSQSPVNELENGILPTNFELGQNYPNPFNPSTKLDFAVPTFSKVNISVFNILGQKIATLVDGEYAAGYYSVDWDSRGDDGSEVASGIYFYKLEANNFTDTKKLMLIR